MWPAGIPKFLSIELTSHCNRDCFFCPRHDDRSGKRKDSAGNPVIRTAPTDKVYSLIDQATEIFPKGQLITFHHLSEPFLDKRLTTFARYAKQKGFSPIIHTNGDVLKDNPKLCRDAVQSFDEITVGLYDYRNSIERSIHEFFWRRRLRGTKLHFTRHEIVFPRHNADRSHPQMRNFQKAVDDARPHPCNMVREQFIVHYDGNIGLCCEDHIDLFKVGNAYETPLKDLVFSARRFEAMHILAEPGGRQKFKHCDICPYGPNIVDYVISPSTPAIDIVIRAVKDFGKRYLPQ